MRQPIRAAAIIVSDSKVLLMHRFNLGKEYWVFPGGGVEDKETLEQTLVRELKEEMTLDIKPGKMVYHIEYIGLANQYYFLCGYNGQEPKLGANSEEQLDTSNKKSGQVYEPVWVPLSEFKNRTIYPVEIRDVLEDDIKNDFKNNPRNWRMLYEQRKQG